MYSLSIVSSIIWYLCIKFLYVTLAQLPRHNLSFAVHIHGELFRFNFEWFLYSYHTLYFIIMGYPFCICLDKSFTENMLVFMQDVVLKLCVLIYFTGYLWPYGNTVLQQLRTVNISVLSDFYVGLFWCTNLHIVFGEKRKQSKWLERM